MINASLFLLFVSTQQHFEIQIVQKHLVNVWKNTIPTVYGNSLQAVCYLRLYFPLLTFGGSLTQLKSWHRWNWSFNIYQCIISVSLSLLCLCHLIEAAVLECEALGALSVPAVVTPAAQNICQEGTRKIFDGPIKIFAHSLPTSQKKFDLLRQRPGTVYALLGPKQKMKLVPRHSLRPKDLHWESRLQEEFWSESILYCENGWSILTSRK